MLLKLSLAVVMIAASAAALAGCEVEGQSFRREQLTSNRSVVYVYRPYRLMGAALEPEVTCGHSTIAIGAGGYHSFVEPPGEIACYASSDAGSRIAFETRPETEYFIREEVAPGVTAGRVALTRVDRSTGMDQIGSCKVQ